MQSMWLWLFAGVHNDAKPIQMSWEGEVRVAGVLWTMDGRECSAFLCGKFIAISYMYNRY